MNHLQFLPFLGPLTAIGSAFKWRTDHGIPEDFRIQRNETLPEGHLCLSGNKYAVVEDVGRYMHELATGKCRKEVVDGNTTYNCEPYSIVNLWRKSVPGVPPVLMKNTFPLVVALPTLADIFLFAPFRADSPQWKMRFKSAALCTTVAGVALPWIGGFLVDQAPKTIESWSLTKSGIPADPSGHVAQMMTVGLSIILVTIGAQLNRRENKANTSLNLVTVLTGSVMNVVYSAASSAMLFNTAACWHTNVETVYGGMLLALNTATTFTVTTAVRCIFGSVF